MGYFSKVDLALQEAEYRSQRQHAKKMDALKQRLEYLQEQFEALEDSRPHDPLDPMYDRYFYADHITEPYELAKTAEGLYEAITLVLEEMAAQKNYFQKSQEWLKTIAETGSTPEGQIVLSPVLFPLEQYQMPAA